MMGGRQSYDGAVVMGEESIMSKKAHGTCPKPCQKDLLWNCKWETADRICCFNRHYAEHGGYFKSTTWEEEIAHGKEITYRDSVTGKPLFIAPRGRDVKSFLKESEAHGWPSFRDEEVVWDNVRVLKGGETVSVDGTHLGHNLPDRKGNRYCINLVCVAGKEEVGSGADDAAKNETAASKEDAANGDGDAATNESADAAKEEVASADAAKEEVASADATKEDVASADAAEAEVASGDGGAATSESVDSGAATNESVDGDGK